MDDRETILRRLYDYYDYEPGELEKMTDEDLADVDKQYWAEWRERKKEKERTRQRIIEQQLDDLG